MFLLKILLIPIFSALVILLSFVIFPYFIYKLEGNKKIEKFLEHDLVRLFWVFLTVIVDTLLIMGFIYLIDKL